MILSFNARDTHPKDKRVIDWYKKLYKSEKSRKIIDILYAHINGDVHTMKSDIGDSLEIPNNMIDRMEIIDLTGGEELDLDSKLNMLGGGEW